MPGLLGKIAKLFEYKEPRSKELGFELLEPDSENPSSEQTRDEEDQNNEQSNADKRNASIRRKHRGTDGAEDDQKQTTGDNKAEAQNQDKGASADPAPDNRDSEQSNTGRRNASYRRRNRGTGRAEPENDQDQTSGDNKTGIQKQDKDSSVDQESNSPNGSAKNKPGSDQKASSPVQIRSRDKKHRSDSEKDADAVSSDLAKNLEIVKQKFLMPKNQDVITRELRIGRKVKAFMVYLDGMSDQQTLNRVILPTLMSRDACDESMDKLSADYLIENILPVHGVKKADNFNDIVLQVLGGVSALFIDGCTECILLETKGYDKRGVESPKTESVVRGPQEAFTEDLRTNITLIRRIVRNKNLVTEMMLIGSTSHENCAILYLDGVANRQVIEEVKKRLKSIKTDLITGSGMIEQFIEDNTFMLFPQLISTERPDRTASFLMEGQVVIITDGSPFALSAPITFFRLFHTSEDMEVRWPTSNFLRLIRLFGLFCATFLPGLYVAITLYHIEMIPTELLLSIARAKEQVPFPTILEVLMMEVSFELIREGGIRVPSVIGQTLGIVGALILGQAAVSAGLVSPLLVIVVSITGLGSFAIPNYSLALSVRIIRFVFIFAGALLGFYGLSLVGIVFVTIACGMKSFGVPYFSPVAPKTKDSRDVVFRHPLWSLDNITDAMSSPSSSSDNENKELWIAKGKRKGGRKEGQNDQRR